MRKTTLVPFRGRRDAIVAAVIVVLFGLGVLAGLFWYGRPWHRALFIEPLHRLPTEERVIALTFDDGPSHGRTPPLLELLEIRGVRATFFMLGRNIERFPDIARSVVEQGHVVGNHSYDHPRFFMKTFGFIRRQIQRTNRLLDELGVTDLRYFRPPYSFTFINLPLYLLHRGMILVAGSYDPPAEYSCPFDAELVARQVLSNLVPGAIIYLHDGKDGSAAEFVEAVEKIITGARERGYRFVGIDYEDS